MQKNLSEQRIEADGLQQLKTALSATLTNKIRRWKLTSKVWQRGMRKKVVTFVIMYNPGDAFHSTAGEVALPGSQLSEN